MKYLYIVLIGVLLIGCGASDDGDKGNFDGSTSADSNTPSPPPSTKGDDTSTIPTKGDDTSTIPTKGDDTSTIPTKGDIGASTTYTEGDIVIILKNASKSYAKSYSDTTRNSATEKGLTALSKDLASESCESLGFVYKTTVNEDGITVKDFTKGDATCSERTVTDSTKVGTFNILFLLRN